MNSSDLIYEPILPPEIPLPVLNKSRQEIVDELTDIATCLLRKGTDISTVEYIMNWALYHIGLSGDEARNILQDVLPI